ncbi:IS110 family transposase [Cellulomonas sp. JH27-2]|uniref:IS110 family transposase n=1 Tax=Cellulomonas sp. JH27-2 TaxID=2774139 RepID=UPI0017853AF4|nr:IS110 family transposase [Cellulomonas sp. JH27-2]MBD8060702.1 IS110 family transposase [Cellulomonas sp. JH27-2]
MVVVIGADVHKASHTLVAVDEVGKVLGQGVFTARREGHRKALGWARHQFKDAQLVWAVEDCRHLTALLERDLLAAGQSVVRVSPKLMGVARRAGRERGKSDPIDATAVARAAQAHADLPVARHDEASRELKLLVDRREDLVAERTRMINRLRWHLHEIDPDLAPPTGSLDRVVVVARLHDQLAAIDALVARIAVEVLDDIAVRNTQIRALERRITAAVERTAPVLLEVPGCGPLTAAKIVGETAGIDRFTSEAAYAMFTGTAPIPVWSGATAGRVRLNRAGNRQLNAALHRIAITQVRLGGPGRDYYDKKRAAGKTSTETYRCLRRQLARTIYNTLNHSRAAHSGALSAAA